MHSLKTRAFRFARPRDFNDPFDCGLTVADDAIEESVRHALDRAARDAGVDVQTLSSEAWDVTPEDVAAYKRYQAQLLGVSDSIGLLCLSERHDDLLMWSHYADRHRGFVLGFERSPENIVGRQASPVVYQQAYPRLSLVDFDPKTNPQSAEILWLTKSVHWAYEREWRLLAQEGGRSYTLDAAICSVVFGMRMSDSDRVAARSALAGLDTVQWHKAVRSSKSYALEIRHLTTESAIS